MTELPIDTSVIKTSCSAAHTKILRKKRVTLGNERSTDYLHPRLREYQVFQDEMNAGHSTRKRAKPSFIA